MAYKIFISYTGQDRKLAEAIERNLSNAYWGEIDFFLAHNDIQAGDKWKEGIKSNLESCSAIINIITKSSIQKPWIFIEWSAFWIAGKKFYIFVTDDINISELINPMQEHQLAFITNVDSVKGLLKRLAEDAAYQRSIPFTKAEEFVVAVKAALIEQEREFSEKTFARYKENLNLLPADDRKKEDVAKFFLETKDFEMLTKVSQKISNMQVKADIASQALLIGYPEICYEISKDIWSPGLLGQIIIQYLEHGLYDSKYVRRLIDEIVTKDQGQLGHLSIYLAEQGKEDTALFASILDEFTNMAELRKVGEFFLQNSRHETGVFHEILEKFSGKNQAELRKLAILTIQENKFHSSSFEKMMAILIFNNQREAVKVVKALQDRDDVLYGKYKNQITNSTVLEYLEQ